MSNYAILGTDAEGVAMFKGDGWGIDGEHIVLNGIDAKFIYELEHRYITVKGPAVKDIFKHLCDLIKKNGALTEGNERLTKENQGLKKFCEEQRENFDVKIKKRDERIDCLTKTLQQEIFDGAVLRTRLDKKTDILENKVDEYERRICGTTAIVPKPSPGYCIVFERINVSSVDKNSDGTYNICLWGNSVESLREKMAFLEENNKAYSELCMSLQQITDLKEIPNERAYTEHDAD